MTTKNELLNAMVGHASTNKWDVVCSYDEKQFNSMLLKKYQEGKLVKEVTVKIKEWDDFDEVWVHTTIIISLKEPLLQFIEGERSSCELTMPIEGGHYTKTKKDKTVEGDIPKDVYDLICTVPLVAISGDMKIHDGKNIINFNQNKKGDHYHVAIHFQNDKQTIFDIEKKTDMEDKSPLNQPGSLDKILSELKVYFQKNIKELEYILSGLNNQEENIQGEISLQPKSFVFAAQKDGNRGALSLYIQTESGNDPGNKTPSFQPGDNAVSPVPESYRASLILSEKIWEKFLSKITDYKLEFCGFSDGKNQVKATPVDGDGKPIKTSINISHSGVRELAIDTVNINYRDCPFYLYFGKDRINVSWDFTQNISWKTSYATVGGGFTQSGGEFRINITVNKKASISLTDRELRINCSINEDDYAIETKCIEGSSWFGDYDLVKNALKSELKRKHILKSFHLNFKPLYFFYTTNLLFPGDQIIDIDTREGIHVPYDIIFFGDLS